MATIDLYRAGNVPRVRDDDMKRTWYLATGYKRLAAGFLKNLHGKRCDIECGFRETKDIRFGMAMGSIRVSPPRGARQTGDCADPKFRGCPRDPFSTNQ